VDLFICYIRSDTICDLTLELNFSNTLGTKFCAVRYILVFSTGTKKHGRLETTKARISDNAF